MYTLIIGNSHVKYLIYLPPLFVGVVPIKALAFGCPPIPILG